MDSMRMLLVTVLAILSGCAGFRDTEWLNHPSEELMVRWDGSRNAKSQIGTDNVCYVWIADNERDLSVHGATELQRCATAKIISVTESMQKLPLRKLRLYVVSNQSEVENRFISYYGMRAYKDTMYATHILQGIGDTPCLYDVNCRGIGGFVIQDSNGCSIIIPRGNAYPVAGHEMEHCFKGNFHAFGFITPNEKGR